MKVLVTGSKGFVGRPLVRSLQKAGYSIVEPFFLASDTARIKSDSHWGQALDGVKLVIHLAARVHVARDTSPDVLDTYRDENTENCLNLARQAAEAGVKQFVFMSSVKALASKSSSEALTIGSDFTPTDPYGISKMEAEIGLNKLADMTKMKTTIIRAPLIYGPGAKGNFRHLAWAIENNLPLPLGSIANTRSYLFVLNLVDLIISSLGNSRAWNQTFFASDGYDLSTPELIRQMGIAMKKKAVLFPFPKSVLSVVFSAIGKRDLWEKLSEDLNVELEHTKKKLDWTPPYTLSEGLGLSFGEHLN